MQYSSTESHTIIYFTHGIKYLKNLQLCLRLPARPCNDGTPKGPCRRLRQRASQLRLTIFGALSTETEIK